MSNDLFEYDPKQNTLRFLKPEGAALLRHWLTRGKHGDYLDDLLVLNAELAKLIWLLPDGTEGTRFSVPSRPDDAVEYSRDYLNALADRIACHGGALGWWKFDTAGREQFVREVVAAPHAFTTAEVAVILDAVDAALHRARKLANAAHAGET